MQTETRLGNRPTYDWTTFNPQNPAPAGGGGAAPAGSETWWTADRKDGQIRREDGGGRTLVRPAIGGRLVGVSIRDARYKDGSPVVNKTGDRVRFISLHLENDDDGAIRVDTSLALMSAVAVARALHHVSVGDEIGMWFRDSGKRNSEMGKIWYWNFARVTADGIRPIMNDSGPRYEDLDDALGAIRRHPAFIPEGGARSASSAKSAPAAQGAGYRRLLSCLLPGWVGPNEDPGAWCEWMGRVVRREVAGLEEISDAEWAATAQRLEGKDVLPASLRKILDRRAAERAAAAAGAGAAPADEYDPFADEA